MDYTAARQNMVENQIRVNRVTHQGIIDAFGKIPREVFVPDNLATLAYVDEKLMITEGRYLLQPMVLALLLQSANIRHDDVVLEIGCGINPHSLRMSNGKMMSGEWKMPIFDNNIGTIRLNPNDEQYDINTIHIGLGALKGIHLLFK